MALPAIVAGSVVKGTRRATALASRPELVRGVRARERRRTREENPLTPEQRLEQNNNFKSYSKSARGFEKVGKALTGKNLRKGKNAVIALATTGWIISWTWPLYIAQLVGFIFWIMGLGAGLAAEESWFAYAVDKVTGLVTDASEIFIGLGVGFGLITVALGLMIAFSFYLVRGVPCFKGNSLLVMAVVFALSVTPLNFLPLVWLWCLYVVMSQAK